MIAGHISRYHIVLPLSRQSRLIMVSVQERKRKLQLNKNYESSLAKSPHRPTSATRIRQQSKLDSFLASYCEYTSCTSSFDIILRVFVYSLWMLAWATRSSPTPYDESNNVFSSSMYDLMDDIHLCRYIFRFSGFLEAIEGIRTGSWAGGSWEDPRIIFISKYFLAGSMLIYYPFDHLVYLGFTIPRLVKVDPWLHFSYSCRVWFIFIIAELAACRLKLMELKRNQIELELAAKKNDDKTEVFTDEYKIYFGRVRFVKLQLLRSLCTLIPAISWSFYGRKNSMFGEAPENGLMLIEAYLALYQEAFSSDGNDD